MLQTENRRFFNRKFAPAIYVFICSSLIPFLGCTGAKLSGIERSPDVTHAFETYHVFPDHQYYYLNQENNPYAVVALERGYSIGDPLWREFDPQSEKLEKIVELVKRFPVTYSYAYGSVIKDAGGNGVGYCYTSLRLIGIRVDPETQNVLVSTDTPWLRDDDFGFGTRHGVGIRLGR